MSGAAFSVIFAGLLVGLAVHPATGLAISALGVALLFWRLWALVLLPLVWLGAQVVITWREFRAQFPQQAGKP